MRIIEIGISSHLPSRDSTDKAQPSDQPPGWLLCVFKMGSSVVIRDIELIATDNSRDFSRKVSYCPSRLSLYLTFFLEEDFLQTPNNIVSIESNTSIVVFWFLEFVFMAAVILNGHHGGQWSHQDWESDCALIFRFLAAALLALRITSWRLKRIAFRWTRGAQAARKALCPGLKVTCLLAWPC